MKKLLVGGAAALALTVGLASPAFAFDCFNPTKPAGAGSQGTVVLDENGDEVAFIPSKSGHGGFVTIDATALGAGEVSIHTFGTAQGGKDGEAGPQDRQPKLACDGKGIDYVEACFAP